MRVLRFAALSLLVLLVLQGCEDDPILEPTPDDGGGGSYGNMSVLSAPRSATAGARNPATF